MTDLKKALVETRSKLYELDQLLAELLPGWEVSWVTRDHTWDDHYVEASLRETSGYGSPALTPERMIEIREAVGAEWIGHSGCRLLVRWNLK